MKTKVKILVAIAVALCSLIPYNLYAQQSAEPRFEDFSVPVWRGRLAAVNVRSHPDAPRLRTRLREDSRTAGINFAGHYSFVGIGCGTNCSISAIVDRRSGRVFFPRELSGWYFTSGENWGTDDEEDFIRHQPNSRLLRVVGYQYGLRDDRPRPGTGGIYYFEWVNNRLRLVRFIRKPDVPELTQSSDE
jgi:hypothetical protein